MTFGVSHNGRYANGNMLKRRATNSTCSSGGDTLTYDQENQLTSITVGATTTTYGYDGDGARVKKTGNGVTTYFIGNNDEVTSGNALKYYSFGTQRDALRNSLGVMYLHSDHLGSTSVTTDGSGTCTSAQAYRPYGDIRSPAPTLPCSGIPATDFGFTGQRNDASAKLMYYGARYYDTDLERFISPDTVVPQPINPQTLNRFTYSYNNPLRYSDPTGHDGPDIINAMGEFTTGVADEAWYNVGWFVPSHEALQVKQGESEAMLAGRVVGDVIALGIGIDETIVGGGMIGSGAAACGTVVLCFAGAGDMLAGVAVGGSGIGTAGNAVGNGQTNLQDLITEARSTKPIDAIDPPTNRGGLRTAMEKAGIRPPRGLENPQVHHNLPWVFRDWFAGKGRGLNVNDVQFGRWVAGAPEGPHQGWTAAYQRSWETFISRNQGATREQVLNYLNDLINSGDSPIK